MGYMVGMPCLKLNNVGRKTANCGSFGSVAAEALEERRGKDPDIDRERSSENIYTGFKTAAELQAYSQDHVAVLSEQQRAAGGRSVRADAVVMIATVIKPPVVYMATLSREDQIRLLQDAKEKLEDIIGSENVKSTVMHFDEQGGHLHAFWEPMTKDGRLCAKEKMNLKFFNQLNKEMPPFLRSRGWDIDDCRAYDAAREQQKSEQEKYQERRERGQTSVVYKAQAEAEKNRICAEIDDLQEDLKQAKADLAATKAQAEQAEKLKNEAEERLVELIDIHSTAEYHEIADYAENTLAAIEASRSAVNDLHELPKLAAIWNRQNASTRVQKVSTELYRILDTVKSLVRRLLGYERFVKMPEQERRAPKLEDRVKAAEKIAAEQREQIGRGNVDRGR